MSKNNFYKYGKGTITVEIIGNRPERILNLLWNKGIYVKNIRRKSLTSSVFDVDIKDYEIMIMSAKKIGLKVSIVNRTGIAFTLLKLKKRYAFLAGIVIFVILLNYLSLYIWSIDIEGGENIAPFEIRQELKNYGVVPFIKKSKINIYDVENKLLQDNQNIMWDRVRYEGAKLKVSIAEKQSPPIIKSEEDPSDVFSKKDGEIARIYITSGTEKVKIGDIVKKGDLLIKGEQGKEGNEYPVHAKGIVIGRTFEEGSKIIKLTESSKQYTNNSKTNYYININNKKIYLKNNVINYEKYDKIIDDKSFIKKEKYVEYKYNNNIDRKKMLDEAEDVLYERMLLDLYKGETVISKKTDVKVDGDNCILNMTIILEENLANSD